jgi:hypothetical protein
MRNQTRFRRYRGRRVHFSWFALSNSFSTVPRASGSFYIFCAPELFFGGTEGVGSRFNVLRGQTHIWRKRGRRVPFSCFALPDSFSALPRASYPVFMFYASGLVFAGTEGVGDPFSCFARPDSFSTVPRASGPVFMFCTPGLVFGGTEGVGSHFQVLSSQTRFRRYRGRRVPFSCFARPYSFLEVPKASGPVIMFCVPELVFGGVEGVGSRFHVLRARTRFRRYRGRRVSFSCFALPDSFSAEPRASYPVFMFCAPRLISGGSESIGSRFHVLRARAHFRRYRGRRVPFLSFALPDSFSAVRSASGPVFMFCALGLVFDGTNGVGSHFLDLPARTHFRLYRRRRVPISCFSRPELFSVVPRVSGPVYMLCAPGLVFGGIEGVGCSFHVLRARTHFQRNRGHRVPFLCFTRPNSFSAVPKALDPVFMLCEPGSFSAVPRASGPVFKHCSPGLIFGRTEGLGSRFHILRARTRFRRYRGRRVSFSCFARSESFCAPGLIFMFCPPGLIFGGTEGVRLLFHVLPSRNHFRRYEGRRVPFSCFARPGSFSVASSASGSFFMFCSPGLIFSGTEGVGSCFYVLRGRARFRRYLGRRVPFSSFARPDSFLAVTSASGPIFMFCAPRLIFVGTEGVGSHFHVLQTRNRFQRCRVRPVPF